MATSAGASKELVDEQFEEEFLQCLVCREKFDQSKRIPKVLPCHHTYCLPCLQRIWNPRRGNLKCPMCCKESSIIQSPAELPSDHKVIKLLDWACQAGAKPKSVCSIHKGERVYFLCDTCKVPVCQQCTVIAHREIDGHQILDNVQVLARYNDELRRIEGNSEDVLKKLQDKVDVLKDSIKQLEKSKDRHIEEIEQKFQEYRRALDQCEEKLIRRVNQRWGQQRDVLKALRDSTHEVTARLQELSDDFKASIKTQDIFKLLSTGQKMRAEENLFMQTAASNDSGPSLLMAENEEVFRSDMYNSERMWTTSDPQLEDIDKQIERLLAVESVSFMVSAEFTKLKLKDNQDEAGNC